MINELFELQKSMAEIETTSWNKDYKPCPKSQTYMLMVGSDQNIANIVEIEKEKRQSYRKWEKSNGFSFPAFNILPKYHADSDQSKEIVKSFIANIANSPNLIHEQFAEVEKNCTSAWTPSQIHKTSKSLQDISKKLLDVLDKTNTGYESMPKLIERAKQFDADSLYSAIKTYVFDKAIQHHDFSRDLLEAFIVTTASKPKSISVVLELSDASHYPYPANHSRTQTWINQCLQKKSTENKQSASDLIDAFGKSIYDNDLNEKFPSIRLPILGDVKLRSMSSESPCQRRYKAIDSKSYFCSSDIRQRMKDSLEWLGSAQRQGITWENVSEACNGASALLFAYPEYLPTNIPAVVSFFAPPNQDALFEETAGIVIPAVQGIVNEKPSAEIRLFAISKADKARTKILVSQHYSAQSLINSANEWQNGCKNIPEICLTQKKPIAPTTPYPSTFVRVLNTKYIRDGTQSADFDAGFTIRDAVVLLLHNDIHSAVVVERAQRTLFQNLSPLLLCAGEINHMRSSGKTIKPQPTKHASYALSMLGLLLYKQNILKGDYDMNAPFLIGRMMALADMLHVEYCKHVRENSVPPKLIGNSIMQTALTNPEAGLARLTERLPVYQAWARTTQGEKVGLSKWALKMFGETADALKEHQPLPTRCTDADKAQMLLGYLAKIDHTDTSEEKTNE